MTEPFYIREKCPYGYCTMRNLCVYHCVRAKLEERGIVRNEKGELVDKEGNPS